VVHQPLLRLVYIEFTLLGVIFFTVGFFMLRSLKMYFKDFYKEFGCQLWLANVLLTFPLTFRAIFDAAMLNDAFNYFWLGESNYYKIAIYNMILITFATYIPMVMQIASLIFGFVRYKKVKLFRSFRALADEEGVSADRDSDDGATSQSLNTENQTHN